MSIHSLRGVALRLAVGGAIVGTLGAGALAGPALASDDGASMRKAGDKTPEYLVLRKAGGDKAAAYLTVRKAGEKGDASIILI